MGFKFRYSRIADRIAAPILSNQVTDLKKPFAYFILLVSLVWLSSPAGSAYTAQNDGAHIRQKRAMEVSDLGMLNPAGLAFSPAANAFYVIEARQQAQDSYTDIVKLTLAADRAGTARIGAAIRDPINMAFDEQHNRLLIFQADSNQLIEVLADTEGNLDPATLERHDARHFGLLDPQGMTIDQMSGHLFILDSAGPRILRIEPEADGSFDHAAISEVEDQTNDLVEPRGLAFDPTTGHIHVVNPAEQELYELTQTGQLVTTRDLAEFELAHPQGTVFAPSGDRTDDPSQMSLYLAERGGDALQGQLDTQEAETLEAESAVGAKTAASGSGDVLEFTFVESQAVSESTFQSSLVQTIEASQWDPPSPDTAGITYAADKNRLLVSDSEVNEMSIYEGVNLFEITLTGDVLETGTTEASSSSNEPTGTAYNLNNGDLFISDDNKDEIFLFAPGSDGVYGTVDDIVTSFDTDVFGGGDPEGVAFDSDGQGTLYIVDGVNSEVYTVTPGPNGVFDGTASDDQVTSFDTLGHGLEDPEGVAFNPNTGTLYAVGKPEDTLFELTTAGDLVQTIDISAANADKPAGLAYAPGSQDSTVMNIYVAQRGVDNGSDPNENDGKIFEMTLPVGEDAPPEANDDSASTVENTTVTIDVAANDSDPNGNLDSTSANTSCSNGSTGCSDPTNGTLVNNGDGTFTYSPDTDFTGSDSFVYEICDTDNLCDTATVSITVSVNSPPVANDDSASTSVDTAVTIDVAANDSDSEGNLDPSSANTSCGTCTVPSEGSLGNNGDGTFTYTPNPGFTGSDSFVYQICDTAGACDTATATVTVENIIDVRVSAGDDDAEEQEDLSVGLGSSDLELVLEDSNQTVGMRFNGIDVPQGATIADAYIQFQTDETDSDATSLTIQGEATDNALTFTTADGNISGRARTTAAVSWAPAAWTTRGEAGPDQQTPDIAPIIQEIVDRPGWASGNSMVIIITGSGKRVAESYNGDQAGAPLLHVEYTSGSVNDAPVANDDAYSTDEDTTLNVAAPGVLGNDTDADGDALTAVLDAAPSNGSLTLNSDGSFDYTPNAGFTGTDSFSYHAYDGTADSNVATVSITVNAVNDPLSVTGIDPNSAAIDSTVDVTVSGTGFQPGATLSLENGQGPAPDVTNVVVVDDSTLTATLIIKQGGPPRDRPWDVRVTNPDGQTDVLPGGFTVTYAAAATTSDTTTTSSPRIAE